MYVMENCLKKGDGEKDSTLLVASRVMIILFFHCQEECPSVGEYCSNRASPLVTSKLLPYYITHHAQGKEVVPHDAFIDRRHGITVFAEVRVFCHGEKETSTFSSLDRRLQIKFLRLYLRCSLLPTTIIIVLTGGNCWYWQGQESLGKWG